MWTVIQLLRSKKPRITTRTEHAETCQKEGWECCEVKHACGVKLQAKKKDNDPFGKVILIIKATSTQPVEEGTVCNAA
jgi:hypothetical protein